jgi:hypothetical protein
MSKDKTGLYLGAQAVSCVLMLSCYIAGAALKMRWLLYVGYVFFGFVILFMLLVQREKRRIIREMDREIADRVEEIRKMVEK